MKLARYTVDGRTRAGAVVADRAVDLADLGAGPGDDVVDVLAAGPERWAQLGARARDAEGRPLSAVRLLPPIPRPASYLGLGMNYRSHQEEVAQANQQPQRQKVRERYRLLDLAFPNPRFPTVFHKQPSCVVGPGDEVWIPRESAQVDYEGELAIVIGRRTWRATEAEAEAAIGGYLVANDVSVRNWQFETTQMWWGKSYPTHGPLGPCVVTADEFDLPAAVLRTWVNDELRQECKLSDMHRPPASLVSLLSRMIVLQPGDVIATGTPAGIGSLHGRFLAPGDRVRVTIDGIGTLENPVVAEPEGQAR